MNKVRDRWERARGKWRIRSIRGGKWWRERGKKGLSAIPHLFTLLNLCFGVGSILLTMSGNFRTAALMVVGSLVADGLDGRLARMLKADGQFGKELDSLADVVSFGTAPAILLYQMALQDLGIYGIAVAMVFPMCGALRLARFNIIMTSGFFLGVPITAAGTLLTCISFYNLQGRAMLPTTLLAVVMLLLSYLMICTIPYPDFKKRSKKAAALNPWAFVGPVAVIVLLLLLTGWNPWTVVLLPLTVYATLGPWLHLVKRWTEKIALHRVGPRKQ